jgi:hypothetical protein
MKTIKYTMSLAMAVALVATINVNAGENMGSSAFVSILTSATSAELPAKSAELVSQADAKNLNQTTMDVVKAAVGLNPAAAPAIVGSISQSSPSMAATAASTAVALVPSEVVAISKAAASAAPAQAGAIVEAICKVMPTDYKKVAAAVAQVAPEAGKEILAGVAAALPELKNVIDEALASFNTQTSSVAIVLSQASESIASQAPMYLPQGPQTSPVNNLPIPVIPVVENPSSGGTVPSGGRPPAHGYAAP